MKICGQKKKSITTWFLCALCTVVLLGCGGISVDTQSDNATDKIEIQDNNTTDKVEIQDENTTDTTEMSDSEVVAETVDLTEQELTQWTDYVNSRENNAFLLSYYDEPKQIDLNELFYTGCGLDMEVLTEKEVQEYLEWAEMDEVYTDLPVLPENRLPLCLNHVLD